MPPTVGRGVINNDIGYAQVRGGDPERLRVGDVRPRDRRGPRDVGPDFRSTNVRRRRAVQRRGADPLGDEHLVRQVPFQRRLRRHRLRGHLPVLFTRPRYSHRQTGSD